MLFCFQLRAIEGELEEERKQRAAAVAAKKKLEGEFESMDEQIEGSSKAKDDAMKQLKKAQVTSGFMYLFDKGVGNSSLELVFWCSWYCYLRFLIMTISFFLQNQLKEFHRDIDELRQSRDELLVSARESEKKAKNLEADLMQSQEDHAAAERQRRAAESERDELQEELASGMKDK